MKYTTNSKTQYKIMTAVFVIAGMFFVHHLPVANGAGIIPALRVYPNGGTVYATSKNLSSATDCYTTVAGADYCFVAGKWSDNKETLTVKMTPPSGKVLDSWNSSYCSDSSATCSVSFSLVTDEDGLSSSRPDDVELKPTYKAIPVETPVVEEPVKTTSPSVSQAAAPTPSSEESKKPTPSKEKPILNFAMNGETYSSKSKKSFQFAEKIQLTGSTFSRAKVTLYIFSEPKVVSITADETGGWSYEVTDLEPGNHRVEVQTVDPETNETSERVVLASFTVAEPIITTAEQAAQSSVASSDSKDISTWAIVAAIALIAIVVVGILLINIQRLKKRKHEQSQSMNENRLFSQDQSNDAVESTPIDEHVDTEAQNKQL